MLESKQKIAQVVNHSRRNPTFFLKNVMGVQPHEWQDNLLHDVSDGKDVSVRSGHGVGKTCVCSWVILWWLFVYPESVVPVTGPTEQTVKDILWPELKSWWEGSPMDKVGYEWEKTKFYHEERADNWKALIRTSSDPQNIAGFHNEHLLYVVEEASAVDDEVFEVLEGALSDGGQKIMIGNPTRSSGEFYRSFHSESEFYSTYHISGYESERVSEEWIKKQEKKWGKDSDIVRVRVSGEFPRGTEDSYISLEIISNAFARSLKPTGNLCLGVDPARFGDDDTAITVRQGPVVHEIETHQKKSTQETAGIVMRKAKDCLDKYDGEEISIKVDETGLGGGVIDRLVEESVGNDKIEVIGINFNQNPTEEEQDNFKSAIDEMFDVLRERGEDGDLDLPRNDKLVSHIAGRKYRTLGSGRVKMEPKKKFKERVGESPDNGDSVLLSFYEPEGDVFSGFF